MSHTFIYDLMVVGWEVYGWNLSERDIVEYSVWRIKHTCYRALLHSPSSTFVFERKDFSTCGVVFCVFSVEWDEQTEVNMEGLIKRGVWCLAFRILGFSLIERMRANDNMMPRCAFLPSLLDMLRLTWVSTCEPTRWVPLSRDEFEDASKGDLLCESSLLRLFLYPILHFLRFLFKFSKLMCTRK